MAIHRSLILLSIVFFSAWMGCAEDPSAVGLGVLPTGDLPAFFVDTLGAQAIGTSKAIPLTGRADSDVPPWYPQHLFVGGIQTLVAGSFIRFTQIPDSLLGISVDAADLLLVPTVATGDTTLTPTFTIHRALQRWFGDSLSYDSLQLRPGFYFDPTPLPSGVGTGVSDSAAIAIPLDTGMVRQWFTTFVDTGSTNLGCFLRGNANGLIQGYGSFIHATASLQPRLRVAYRKNGVSSSVVLFAGNSRYLATIPSSDLVLDPSKVYVQSGVSYRGLVTFDLTTLPRPVSVSNAIVELTLDSAASNRSSAPDSLVAMFVDQSGLVLKASAVASGREAMNGPTVYSFRIPVFAQQWLRTGTPATVSIAGYAENTTFNRFVLYGQTAAPQLRPRLIITYSKAIATWGGSRR